jgi:hypothetical protein
MIVDYALQKHSLQSIEKEPDGCVNVLKSMLMGLLFIGFFFFFFDIL